MSLYTDAVEEACYNTENLTSRSTSSVRTVTSDAPIKLLTRRFPTFGGSAGHLTPLLPTEYHAVAHC